MAARSLRTTLSARQSGGATSSGSSVECLTCPADRVRERFGPGTVAVADVGWAGLSSTGSSLSQTLVAPAQPFGDLLQRLDLHTARPARHEIPVSDSPRPLDQYAITWYRSWAAMRGECPVGDGEYVAEICGTARYEEV